jgi:2,4-dienoyl-CoA reductase-like NADH-dependent reductase (Old Yellow Enzyme family)
VLFEPITLRELTIPNRAWMSPMCQYSAASDGPDVGAPTDWHLVHLGSRAVGGAGLVMTEATAVNPEGRISPLDLGLWNDRQQAAFARIARFVAGLGTVAGVQLAHAGRKASVRAPWHGGGSVDPAEGGWETVGPSAVAFGEYAPPTELSVAQLARVVDDFAAAARRARDAGFSVVEVHGAHGYLLHEFLSPYSNHRTDAYGGTFANRIRLALEVVEAVRAEWPAHLPVLFRVSGTDWIGDDPDLAWTIEQSVALAKELSARGVDLVDVSSGGNVERAEIPLGPGYQVGLAEAIRAGAGVPVAAVGLITEPEHAEQIIADGRADAVLLARELLRNPYWPRQAAQALGVQSRWPDQYLRAAPTMAR